MSRIPHLRVRQALRAVICSCYCSVISRFRFSLSFFSFPLLSFPFPSLLKGMHCASTQRSEGIGDTWGAEIGRYLSDQGPLSSREDGQRYFPPSRIWNLQLSTLSRSPVFSKFVILFFKGSSFAFIATKILLPDQFDHLSFYIYNFLKAMRNENVILLTIFIMVKSGLMIRVFETLIVSDVFFFYCNWTMLL